MTTELRPEGLPQEITIERRYADGRKLSLVIYGDRADEIEEMPGAQIGAGASIVARTRDATAQEISWALAAPIGPVADRMDVQWRLRASANFQLNVTHEADGAYTALLAGPLPDGREVSCRAPGWPSAAVAIEKVALLFTKACENAKALAPRG